MFAGSTNGRPTKKCSTTGYGVAVGTTVAIGVPVGVGVRVFVGKRVAVDARVVVISSPPIKVGVRVMRSGKGNEAAICSGLRKKA